MGILGALSTAVSGLSAQSYALENISGNIANSQTVGFKGVGTSFLDLVQDSAAGQETSGSVAYSSLTNTLQGTLSATGVSTNMALSGDGYFVVSKNTGSSSQPTFTGSSLYTRRGDYTTDQNGYMVNGAGLYLAGTSYNPSTGAVTGSSTTPVNVSKSQLPAKASTRIAYSGNLPSTPKPNNYSSTVSGSDMLIQADFSTNPVTTGTVVGADQTTFLNESINGGEVSLYNPAGSSATAQLRWAKTASASAGTTWQLFYQTNSAAGATDVAWKSIGSNVTFGTGGALTSGSNVSVSNLTVDGKNFGTINLSFSSGLTQYGDTNGTATTTVDQNGYSAGSLTGMSVGSDGTITGSYSNGQNAKLAQVTIAHFAASNALKREDGGAFSATSDSGQATLGLNGSTISGGSVEQSNTDISDEFSKMIVTQQAYSANTRVMSMAQQMLQDVINIIR